MNINLGRYGGLRVRLMGWKPTDMFVGAYWYVRRARKARAAIEVDATVCILPCIPIRIVWQSPDLFECPF